MSSNIKMERFLIYGRRWGIRGQTLFPNDPTSASPKNMGEENFYPFHFHGGTGKTNETIMKQFNRMLWAGELDEFLEPRFRKN